MTRLTHSERPANASPPFLFPLLSKRLTFAKRLAKEKGKDRKETENTSFSSLFSCKGKKSTQKGLRQKEEVREKRNSLLRTRRSLTGCRTLGRV